MHVVITGANGFIGSHLTKRLLSENTPVINGKPISKLTVVDISLNQLPESSLLNKITGSVAEPSILEQVFSEPADIVFHFAAIPSGLCESEPDLGMEVNVQGMIRLLDILKHQSNVPRLVFSSSIAVYGKPEGNEVDDHTSPKPTLTYGALKQVGEVLVNEYSRRGWIDGISVRVPGIVARPAEPNGAVSIFFSDLIRELSAGKPFTCPVSAEATSWLLSIHSCVDNLIHAATVDIPERKTWSLPASTIVIKDLVQAIANHTSNPEVLSLIKYTVDEWVEFNFGSYPPLNLPEAEALGFKKDSSLEALVKNSL